MIEYYQHMIPHPGKKETKNSDELGPLDIILEARIPEEDIPLEVTMRTPTSRDAPIMAREDIQHLETLIHHTKSLPNSPWASQRRGAHKREVRETKGLWQLHWWQYPNEKPTYHFSYGTPGANLTNFTLSQLEELLSTLKEWYGEEEKE